MATPQGDSYGCASGGVIAAGRYRFPAWLRGSSPGGWVAAPNSTLTESGSGWAGSHPGGTGNYTAIVTAWGGGILNTVGVTHGGVFIPGAFLVIFGGGHGDYAGNELYAYGPLQSDAPIWRRLVDPTIPAPDDVSHIGGFPVSRHTYDTLVYLPVQNKMLCIGAPGQYHTGNAINVSDLFNFGVDPAVSNPWEDASAGFPDFNGGGTGTIGLLSGYDSTTGKAWAVGNGNAQKLASYDANSGAWASYDKYNPGGPGSAKAGLASSLGLMVFQHGATLYVQNLDAPTSPLYTPSVIGSPPDLGSTASLDWDDAGGRFVVRGSGKTLHFLTPGLNPESGGDAWAWSSNTPINGATPATGVTNGTYGRFRALSGALRGVIIMPAHNAPICFYRM